MQLQFGADYDIINNLETNNTETRELKFKPLGFRFLSGEEISYSVINQFEKLPSDFRIFQSFIIPGGSYEWWRSSIQYKTKGARKIWSEGSYSFGDFYNGSRSDFITKVNWKVAIPFFLGGGLIRNNVHLPQGNFITNIYQLNANFLFSPNVTLYNYFQYDNASKSAGCQSRFQWILKPGKEIILAWTSGFKKPSGNYYLDESALRLKIKYNIRF